jgi:sulfhydrogenase subunit alpha
MTRKSYVLDCLTKVEGHAKLKVEMDGRSVKKAEMAVYEPSRYFEHMVLGKRYDEVPSISQRICGICSVVHTVTSVNAVEKATGIRPSEQSEDIRRLLLHASNIHSHTAHLFFFAAPDYMGVHDVIEIARKHREKMKLAIELQRISSGIVKRIGGRPLHPVNCRVGRFNSVPGRQDIQQMMAEFRALKALCIKAAELFLSFSYPEFDNRTQHIALEEEGCYDLYEGGISVLGGRGFRAKDYAKNIEEETVYRSTAKYSRHLGKPYMVGALPRLNINHRNLSPSAKSLLKKYKVRLPSFSPFANNIAQAVEMVHFCDRAEEVLEKYSGKGMRKESPELRPRAGEGIAACEAPRGTLYHHYRFDKNGKCAFANIITPTCQNVRNMEYDLQNFLPSIISGSDEGVKHMLQMLIRAYDPCFSCSTHFLELDLRR